MQRLKRKLSDQQKKYKIESKFKRYIKQGDVSILSREKIYGLIQDGYHVQKSRKLCKLFAHLISVLATESENAVLFWKGGVAALLLKTCRLNKHKNPDLDCCICAAICNLSLALEIENYISVSTIRIVIECLTFQIENKNLVDICLSSLTNLCLKKPKEFCTLLKQKENSIGHVFKLIRKFYMEDEDIMLRFMPLVYNMGFIGCCTKDLINFGGIEFCLRGLEKFKTEDIKRKFIFSLGNMVDHELFLASFLKGNGLEIFHKHLFPLQIEDNHSETSENIENDITETNVPSELLQLLDYIGQKYNFNIDIWISSFHLACHMGLLSTVKSFLRSGYDVNQKMNGELSAFGAAITSKQYKIIELLTSVGAKYENLDVTKIRGSISKGENKRRLVIRCIQNSILNCTKNLNGDIVRTITSFLDNYEILKAYQRNSKFKC